MKFKFSRINKLRIDFYVIIISQINDIDLSKILFKTFVFYISRGKKAVNYLIMVGKALRSSEALHAFAFHHRIDEFWKLLKNTLNLGDMHLRGREGAYVCVAI